MKTKMIYTMRRLARGILPFCLLAILLSLTGCDELVAHFVQADDIDFIEGLERGRKDATHVEKVVFSPDHKTFTVTTRMYEDIGPYSLLDSNAVSISIKETSEGIAKSKRVLPRFVGGRNLKADNIRQAGIMLLVLVDATLPQQQLDRIRDYVIELRAVFSHDNLFVAFMQGKTVSESFKATDYVLDNYFRQADDKFVYLYRSIQQKKDEMTARLEPWKDARRMVLLTFSDGKVYDDETDMPIDPDHYLFEDQMVNSYDSENPDFLASYASIATASNSTMANPEPTVLQQFCSATKGLYMQPYNGTAFKNNILQTFNVSADANEFTFENPDGKVYRGNDELLTVRFTDRRSDSLITSFTASINEGSIYNPIIVHGASLPVILVNGLLLAFIIVLAVWLLFQFVIPYLRYRHFLHKYVVRYTGNSMAVGTTAVHTACYLCKQPFETGDEIVVKCSHTMHRSCWDDNEYHCPEYSDRCKHGSHYYNRHNISDSRNASYYMKWIIMAVAAAWLAWANFTFSQTSFAYGMYRIHHPLPVFGFTMAFFLTAGIYCLANRLTYRWRLVVDIVMRAIVAAVLSSMAFYLTDVINNITDHQLVDILTAWVPWTLSGFFIAICATYGTKVRLRKSLILPGIAFGIIAVYVWWLFFDVDIDYRVLLLLSFIVYAVGLSVSIATVTPRSERFFLKVQGAVKPMDIAIYKWFRNAPDHVVTIGKSVDCNLQLSWDIMGDVAPVHAEVRKQQDVLYLVALEDGVYTSGRPLAVGKRLWLYHGTSFTIGNTTFTYVEKDQ